MTTEDIGPREAFRTMKENRCITCMYLSRYVGDRFREVVALENNERHEIVHYKWMSGHYNILRCYKNMIASEILENNVWHAECPASGWQKYVGGSDPPTAYEQEQHDINQQISKNALRISRKALFWTIISIIVSVALGAAIITTTILQNR